MDWKHSKYWRAGTADNLVGKYYAPHWEPTRIHTSAYSDATTYSVTCDTSASATTIYDNSTIHAYISNAENLSYKLATYYTDAGLYFENISTHFVSTPETEEQRAARVEMEAKYAEEVRLADRTARKMFIRILGIEKYRLLKRLGHFDIVGKTGQRYRLAVGQKVNVMHGCFGDQVKHKLCAYVPDVPQVDTLIAQYLALTSGEKGEDEFAKVAIKHAA